MAVKSFLSLAGGQVVPQLAPDLTSFSSSNSAGQVFVGAINATAGLTTLLSLTGKFGISMLYLSGLTTNDVEGVKLTIDGVVIWEEASMSVNSATKTLVGNNLANHGFHMRCDSSLLLELDTISDTSINFTYLVRPLL